MRTSSRVSLASRLYRLEPYAATPISKELIEWADIILCMEKHHRSKVIKKSQNAVSKTVVLEIPDIYTRGDSELVRLLKDKVSKHLQSDSMRRAPTS